MKADVHVILFDLDDTLIDRTAAMGECIDRWIDHCAPGASDAERTAWRTRALELDARGYVPRSRFWTMLATAEPFCRAANPGAFRERFRDDLLDALQPDDRVLDWLRRLGELYALAIVTNGDSTMQRAKADRTGITDCVSHVTVSGDLRSWKPDPAVFRAALAPFEHEAHSAMMVGDNPEADVLGAASLGMGTVWVSHERPWPDDLRGTPDRTVTTIHQLAEWLP